MRLYIDSSVIM